MTSDQQQRGDYWECEVVGDHADKPVYLLVGARRHPSMVAGVTIGMLGTTVKRREKIRALGGRVAAEHNACAGLKNVAALPALVEAVRYVLYAEENGGEELNFDECHAAFLALVAALAALDEAPE